ncbi:MAG: 1-deoxy-D-xylulose-5-phosphate reductoisomerase [Chloroflexota bacterium]
MNRIAVLGSTGSIGTQTLEVARRLPDRICVVGLAGGRNAELLSEQIAEFRPRFYHSLLPDRVEAAGSRLVPPAEMACDGGIDTLVVATSGIAGLVPTLEALRCGKQVALANKEVLVVAGDLVMRTVRASCGGIVPLDSEHSAIWQCLLGETAPARRLFLTASGGPFYGVAAAGLRNVRAADALAHPVWSMGHKITIDSATMMNKGLELIEAHHLFGVPYDDIEILIHRQCIVHSMVEFIDGSVKAQIGAPDMMLPIQCALTYPDREAGRAPRVDWNVPQNLTFEPVDESYPALVAAREAGRRGMTYPAVLCGADEAAVELFLNDEIGFLDIADLVEDALAAHVAQDNPALEQLLEAEWWARQFVIDRKGKVGRSYYSTLG